MKRLGRGKAGLYIHIPFCKSRCSYCDFATDIYRDPETTERYVNALITECLGFGKHNPGPESNIDTLYFGGGTPSLLSPVQLENLFGAINQTFAVQRNAEITLEMNPASVSFEKLLDFRSLGINRASFGVQTFDDRALKILARGHDSADARNTFKLLRRAGFENVSFDMIGGLPNQSLRDWEKNLDESIKMNPEHISLYLLEIHSGTPLAEQIRQNRQPNPDEELAGRMYEMMVQKLEAAGYEHYEISNFAKPGYTAKHNNKYWKCDPVYGLGCSAHSFDGESARWSNERDTRRYVALIEEGKSPVIERNRLTEEQLSSEFVFLNLRLSGGLDLRDYRLRFKRDLKTEFSAELDEAFSEGLIEFERDHLRLTRRGRLFSNEVFSIFV